MRRRIVLIPILISVILIAVVVSVDLNAAPNITPTSPSNIVSASTIVKPKATNQPSPISSLQEDTSWLETAQSTWVPVGEGIEYREFRLGTPRTQVFVARMDRSNPNVTLESSIAYGRLASGIESVSRMAERYDQAINYWGNVWGNRNQVVVAINGYYYTPSTGSPWRGQVHSSWYAKRYDDDHQSGFAWLMDRNAFIGEYVYHRPEKQVITFLDADNTQVSFDGVNVPRDDDQLILYTPQYDADTHTDNSGTEVLVEMTRPAMLLAPPNSMAIGTIRMIRSKGSTEIPFDHVVLSGHGAAEDYLKEYAKVGDRIGISQEISNYKTSPKVDWTKTYASIGGDFYFLKGGAIQDFDSGSAKVRDPRTAIAYNNPFVFFIVVDGRNPGVSEGMSIHELATFAKDRLQATYGVSQDGGGSSTMVVNGVVVNNPITGIKCQHVFLPMVINATDNPPPEEPEEEPEAEPATFIETPLSGVCERPVANGMMMVVVEPIQQSEAYLPGDTVVTSGTISVRLGPGTNYATIATIEDDTTGQVAAHPNELEGILAKGAYWWLVDFEDADGWVAEGDIVPPAAYLRSRLKNLPVMWKPDANQEE